MSEESQKIQKDIKKLFGVIVSEIISGIVAWILGLQIIPILIMLFYCAIVIYFFGKITDGILTAWKMCIVILGFPAVLIILCFFAMNSFDFEFSLGKSWLRMLNGTAFIYIALLLLIGFCIYISNIIFQSSKKAEKNTLKAFAYATTCILVKENSQNKKELIFCLINNREKNEKEPPWMFPGGHIKMIENGDLLDKISDPQFKVADLDYAPAKAVIEQCKKEAGINNLELISPFKCKSYNTHAGKFAACETPVFNYLIGMTEEAKCYKESGHRVHFHFTYVAKYDFSRKEKDTLPVLEIPVPIEMVNEGVKEATHNIEKLLKEKINAWCQSKSRNHIDKGADELFYRHIPLLIYNTLCFYKENESKFR